MKKVEELRRRVQELMKMNIDHRNYMEYLLLVQSLKIYPIFVIFILKKETSKKE